MKHDNNCCIRCNSRFQEGTQDYIKITMCKPCLKNYGKKDPKKRDYSGFEEAVDLVYHRVRPLKILKDKINVLDYLR